MDRAQVLNVKLPLRPTRVAAIKFAASLIIYFSSPDDFFFLFVAFGQARCAHADLHNLTHTTTHAIR